MRHILPPICAVPSIPYLAMSVLSAHCCPLPLTTLDTAQAGGRFSISERSLGPRLKMLDGHYWLFLGYEIPHDLDFDRDNDNGGDSGGGSDDFEISGLAGPD